MESAEEKAQSLPDRERWWIISVIALATLMYLPTLAYMWEKWMNDPFSLGCLAPAVCAYFAWTKWGAVKKLKRSPTRWGLALIIPALLLHLVGVVLDVSGPSSVSLIVMIVGLCLYFHGAALVRTLAFPLAYMVFMVPIPGGIIDRICLPMQLFAGRSTAVLLRLCQIPVTQAGVSLTVGVEDPFQFSVAEQCSGMSSLVALVGVSAVFAYISGLPTKLKWVLFALSPPIAIAANILRITSIALLGCLWDQDIAMFIHKWAASPILFFFAILLLFVISWGFEWLSVRRTTS